MDIDDIYKMVGYINQQEGKILVHIINGKTNKQIAEDMNLSSCTVKRHIENLMNKLKVKNINIDPPQ